MKKHFFYTNILMIQNLTHQTEGTCARAIKIGIKADKIESVEFDGGCPGNLTGITRLVAGMDVDEVISRMDGIRCGSKSTSCPDQLSRALRKYKEEQVS